MVYCLFGTEPLVQSMTTQFTVTSMNELIRSSEIQCAILNNVLSTNLGYCYGWKVVRTVIDRYVSTYRW